MSNLRLKVQDLEAQLLLSEAETRSKLLKEGFLPAGQVVELRGEIRTLRESEAGLRSEIP